MEIAFFIPSLDIGGAERSVVRLSNKLVEFGHDVQIVTAKNTGNLKQEIRQEITIVEIGIIELPKLGILGSVPYLIRYFKTYSPDVFISFMKHVNITAILSHKLSGSDAPIIINERNYLSKTISNHNPIRSSVILFLMKSLYPLSDGIIAISDGVAKDLSNILSIDRKKITSIYNPVVTDGLIKKSKEPVDHPWFKDENQKVILAVGRLVPQKDFPTLIKAFAKLVENRKVRLMILGEGEKRQELEQLIEDLNLTDSVEMPGKVQNPFTFMKNSSVFVLSSSWEGLGNVLIEAMACGCPVVSTDCPSGPSEILKHGEYGQLVPVGDPDSMANAIEEVLENQPETERIINRAEMFSDTQITNEYLEVFEIIKQV